MSRQSLELLSNETATGGEKNWGGGDALFTAVGTFSGATVKLQYKGPDGVTWVDAGTDTTLTAAGGGIASLPSGGVRAFVSGSPTGMYAKLTSV